MEERKNIIYTATDMQRYHSGSMSENEMHALEKAAMDDPFLADALEGYAFTSTADKDIVELKKRLAGKEEKKKIAFIIFDKKRMWLSAAAMLAFIFGTVYLTFKLNDSNKDSILAKNENNAQETLLAKSDSAVLENKQAPAPVSPATDTLKIIQEPIQAQTAPVAGKANSSNNIYSATEATSDVDDKTDLMDSIAANKAPVAKQSTIMAETKTARRDAAVDEAILKDRKTFEYKTERTGHQFSGKVVDQQGNPVAFASISDTARRKSFTTDAAGNFSISANDSIFAATIACVGYDKQKKEFKPGTDQTIVLSRNTQELTAVVVTSMGQVRQKKSLGYSTASVKAKETASTPGKFSQPVTGMDTFRTYINDSIKKQQKGNGEVYKGEIILSFKIKKDGQPYNVNVEKSLCKPCDEEATRLLLAGPKWKYINNKRIRVTINF